MVKTWTAVAVTAPKNNKTKDRKVVLVVHWPNTAPANMTLHLTHQDARILVDALSMPQGVPKVNRPAAELLRARIAFQINTPVPPKINGTGRIRCAWPTGDVKNSPRPDWSYDKPRKVSLHKATRPASKTTVDDVLKGLI